MPSDSEQLPDAGECGEQSFLTAVDLVVQAICGAQINVSSPLASRLAKDFMFLTSCFESVLCENYTDSGIRIFRIFVRVRVEAKQLARYVMSCLADEPLYAPENNKIYIRCGGTNVRQEK